MYQYLSGKLVEKSATSIVLDVNGIGYWLQVPVSTFSELPSLGEPVKILTHFVVREDAQVLYGFYSQEERELFRQLISVSGIGPKIGLTLLSGIPVLELKKAIIEGAIPVLTSIPGVGRKIAERLIVELREKIVLEEGRTVSGSPAQSIRENDAVFEDSLRALIELGYRKQDAKQAIQKALKDYSVEANSKMSVSELIRASLKCI